jgi:hypothetical protein
MKKRRQATVEPVFGSLLNYLGMRRARARGKSGAHKIMLAAATAYNLQKLTAFPGFPKATAQRLSSSQTNMLSMLTLLVVPQPRSNSERMGEVLPSFCIQHGCVSEKGLYLFIISPNLRAQITTRSYHYR